MTQATDTDIREIKTAIEQNTKAIASLTQEMRSGFSSIKTQSKTHKVSSYDVAEMLKAIETMSLRDAAKILIAATERLTRDYL